MSLKMIQTRLDSYQCRTELEEQQAIREITQEVVLAGLGRGDFFKHALFQGESCLRIFCGLNRYSEDMDFILRRTNPNFKLKDHLLHLIDELSVYGYDIEITDRSKASSAVKKAFLKDQSIGKLLELQYSGQKGPLGKIKIKLEIDTNPPEGSKEELKFLDFPFVSAVSVQDKPSLFAGKLHALLCRNYPKGRDWYDFIWYTSHGIKINYNFLNSAIQQYGPWKEKKISVDKIWLLKELKKKILSLDWKQISQDVIRFIPLRERKSLDFWSKELFLNQLRKL